MDLIFCRNVLMYFTLPHMRKLVDKLHDALDDDGWLAVSPCECSQTLFGDFVSVNFAGTTLYQKRIGRSVAEPWMPPPLSGPVGASLEPLVPPLWAPMKYTAAIEVSDSSDEAASLPTPQPDNPHVPGTSPSSPVSNGESSLSLAAQSFADQGKLNDALAFTERWAATDKLNSAAHYLNAMVLQERGEREHMRRSLNRALYLQPDFALAHFALGNLERADAHETQASKHFENALRLLRSQMPDAPLPHADGLTAGRLSEIISSLLFRPQRAVKAR
jgi:chemotaxis protein methyltransferase CheR